jgi:uncharacterized protein YihD (DUF1040 family)
MKKSLQEFTQHFAVYDLKMHQAEEMLRREITQAMQEVMQATDQIKPYLLKMKDQIDEVHRVKDLMMMRVDAFQNTLETKHHMVTDIY